MKTNHIILSVITLFLSTSLFAQKKDTLKVWGNCGMCKKTIETAAKSAGATVAEWNTETKILTVAYSNQKTSLPKIEKAVAGSGYDTQNLTATDEAYYKLHECCQYDRKVGASATTAGLTLKADDCCANGKCTMVKDGKTVDCCKDGKCTMSKEGKTMDCCKEGKCSTSDCCKKA